MTEFNEITDYFQTYDKMKLFYRSWQPAVKTENYVFIAIHGAAVHSENMDNFGDYFASKGYPVYAYDRRGFGHCDEKIRGHIDSYRIYINDTISFIEYVKQKETPEKIFLVGHSMGGVQAIIIAAENPGIVNSVIVSSPGLELLNKDIFSPFKKPLAKIFSKLIPKMKTPTYLKPEELCKETDRAKARSEDPLYTKKCTARWVGELFSSQKQGKKVIPNLEIPTFFIVSGDDREISSKSTKRLFETIRNKTNMKLKIYEDQFHENFNELPNERVIVFQDIEAFLQLNKN